MPDLDAIAQELCRVFVGWKLREDETALRAIGEGALRVDLRTGETWCDDEPLPSLFIVEELRRELDRALAGAAPEEAALEAVFAVRPPGLAGPRVPALQVGCACRLRLAGEVGHGEARRGAV